MEQLEESQCSLCGYPGPFSAFFPGASLRETRCPGCGSSRRVRDVARVLMCECLPEELLPTEAGFSQLTLASCLEYLRPLRIYELQAQGPLHDCLSGLPEYVCSEYHKDIEPGKCTELGVLCQDVTRLTFPDMCFDVVISQDVMEHVLEPWQGFREINRVLRPGGKHIFTVPLHEGTGTRRRARENSRGKLEHLLPPVYHKDPLDRSGALVLWDFGDDLPALLREQGIPARKALHARLYSPEEICNVTDQESHALCLDACASGRQAGFFLYNSVVFVAEKNGGDAKAGL